MTVCVFHYRSTSNNGRVLLLTASLTAACFCCVSAAQLVVNTFLFLATMELPPWKTASMTMQAHHPFALWQCCTRYANNAIPIGATWVDYIPEVNDTIETHARQGLWLFDINFQTNDTVYSCNLLAMKQTNCKTGAERTMRRCIVPAASRL